MFNRRVVELVKIFLHLHAEFEESLTGFLRNKTMMKKEFVKFSIVPVIAAFIFYSFSTVEALEEDKFAGSNFLVSDLDTEYTVPHAPEFVEEASEPRIYPRLDKSYLAFREAVGFKESGGDYQVINEFGYIGKYQFGRGTLVLIGITDLDLFLNSPQLQELAFYANASRNKWILRRDIARFENKIINGVKITESGILAAAHLGGPGNVKKYLRSGGRITFKDGFGTSIQYYLKKFAGYDTSIVEPFRKAKAISKIKDPSEG